MTEVEFKLLEGISYSLKEIVMEMKESNRLLGGRKSNDIKPGEYGESFRVVGLGDGEKMVTRSSSFAKDGRKLTRADIYKGRWEEAASEYAHAFMCGGFPTKPDPKRPSEEEWMAEEPYPYEVDRYITDKMFPKDLPDGYKAGK